MDVYAKPATAFSVPLTEVQVRSVFKGFAVMLDAEMEAAYLIDGFLVAFMLLACRQMASSELGTTFLLFGFRDR